MGETWRKLEIRSQILSEKQQGSDHLEDLGIDGRILEGCGLVELASQRAQWRAVVYTVMNLPVM
jgi:hypothetical protein